MFDLSKYRKYDYFTIRGLIADVETENENGELINYICSRYFVYQENVYNLRKFRLCSISS